MRVGRLALLVVSVLVTLLAAAGAVSAATPVSGTESDFATRIAGERSSRGLGSLQIRDDLVDVARRHAARMAARGKPYHNASLAEEVQGWQVVGENVGKGPDVADIHAAFMVSSIHRDQIVFPGYTELGVGVVASGGSLYVVQVFRQPMAQSEPAPEPAPTPAPAPEPAPAPDPAPSRPPAAPPPAATSPAPVTAEPAPATPAPVEPAPGGTTPGAEVALPPVTGTGGPGGAGTGLSAGLPPMATFDRTPAGEATIERAVLDRAPEVPPAVGVATGLLALVIGFQGVAVRRLGLA